MKQAKLSLKVNKPMLTNAVPEWLASLPGQSILFQDSPVSFLGRNGVYGAVGLYLVRRDSSPATGPHRLNLAPITSKGNLGRAWLEIPPVAVPALVTVLQDFLAGERAIAAKS
jgi:hypothetical protein